MLEKHSNGEGSAQKSFIIKWNRFCRNMLPGNAKRWTVLIADRLQGWLWSHLRNCWACSHFGHLGRVLCIALYQTKEELCGLWVSGSRFMSGQHPIWKAATLKKVKINQLSWLDYILLDPVFECWNNSWALANGLAIWLGIRVMGNWDACKWHGCMEITMETQEVH